MQEINDNIWYYFNKEWFVIPTDGTASVCIEIPEEINNKIDKILKLILYRAGDNVLSLYDYKIFTFPIKFKNDESINIELIEKSTKQLLDAANNLNCTKILIPQFTCNNFEKIKQKLNDILDNRFIIIKRQA